MGCVLMPAEGDCKVVVWAYNALWQGTVRKWIGDSREASWTVIKGREQSPSQSTGSAKDCGQPLPVWGSIPLWPTFDNSLISRP